MTGAGSVRLQHCDVLVCCVWAPNLHTHMNRPCKAPLPTVPNLCHHLMFCLGSAEGCGGR
jgi:hypothetical protein